MTRSNSGSLKTANLLFFHPEHPWNIVQINSQLCFQLTIKFADWVCFEFTTSAMVGWWLFIPGGKWFLNKSSSSLIAGNGKALMKRHWSRVRVPYRLGWYVICVWGEFPLKWWVKSKGIPPKNLLNSGEWNYIVLVSGERMGHFSVFVVVVVVVNSGVGGSHDVKLAFGGGRTTHGKNFTIRSGKRWMRFTGELH